MDDPPSTSGRTPSPNEEIAGVLVEVAHTISDDGLRKLGLELGFQISDIKKALEENRADGKKTSNGNVRMLLNWAEKIDTFGRLPFFRLALQRAGLFEVEETCFTNSSRACNESKVLCDLYFSDLAEQIGSEWHQLGIRLGLSQADIDQITENKPTAVDRRVAMLQLWKNRSSCTDKRRMVEELCKALSSCDRRDLAGDVKEAAGIS